MVTKTLWLRMTRSPEKSYGGTTSQRNTRDMTVLMTDRSQLLRFTTEKCLRSARLEILRRSILPTEKNCGRWTLQRKAGVLLFTATRRHLLFRMVSLWFKWA